MFSDSGLDVSLEGTSKKLNELDSSQSSIEEEAELAKIQLKEAKKRIKELEGTVEVYKRTFEKLEKLGNFFVREKTAGTPSYGNQICSMILSFLADGFDASTICKFLERLVQTIPVLLDVHLGNNSEMIRSVPKETFVRKLRNCLNFLNRERVCEFISEAKEITIASDDSPSPDGANNYTSVGVYNELGEFALIGYRVNNDKTGEGIKNAMREVLIESGQLKMIETKINKQGAIAMVTDTAAAQKKANRLLLEFLGVEHESGEGISCLMHLGK